MPSGKLQSGENDAVDGDVDEEGRAGRGVVVGGAVVVLLVADLGGGRLCAADGVGGSVRRPCSAPRAPEFADGGAAGRGGLGGADGRAGVVEQDEGVGGGAAAVKSMRPTVGLLKSKTVMSSFVAPRAPVSTGIGTGSSAGLCARPSVGPARHDGAQVRRCLKPPNFATFA